MPCRRCLHGLPTDLPKIGTVECITGISHILWYNRPNDAVDGWLHPQGNAGLKILLSVEMPLPVEDLLVLGFMRFA